MNPQKNNRVELLPTPNPIRIWLLSTVLMGSIFVSGCATPAERLTKAVNKGDAVAAARLFEQGYRPADAWWHLRLAASLGNVEMIKLLLDAGVDVNAGDYSALMAAAENGHLESVKLLIDRGAKVNAQQSVWVFRDIERFPGYTTMREARVKGCGHNALSLAIQNNQPDVVLYLLDHGADREAIVVYANATTDCPVVVRGTTIRMENWRLLPHSSHDIEFRLLEKFIEYDGDRIKTNYYVTPEKTASIRQLAHLSGIRYFTELLPYENQ